MDTWLKRHALANHQSGASRVFVIATKTREVIAYFALAAGSVARKEATGQVRRNMPDPVPAIVLGRLAVDMNFQGQGLATRMLRNAMLRCLRASENIGARVILVHALNERARAWYLRMGFAKSPVDEMVLMLPMRSLRAILGQASDSG